MQLCAHSFAGAQCWEGLEPERHGGPYGDSEGLGGLVEPWRRTGDWEVEGWESRPGFYVETPRWAAGKPDAGHDVCGPEEIRQGKHLDTEVRDSLGHG